MFNFVDISDSPFLVCAVLAVAVAMLLLFVVCVAVEVFVELYVKLLLLLLAEFKQTSSLLNCIKFRLAHPVPKTKE